jgi:hypothetical protein
MILQLNTKTALGMEMNCATGYSYAKDWKGNKKHQIAVNTSLLEHSTETCAILCTGEKACKAYEFILEERKQKKKSMIVSTECKLYSEIEHTNQWTNGLCVKSIKHEENKLQHTQNFIPRFLKLIRIIFFQALHMIKVVYQIFIWNKTECKICMDIIDASLYQMCRYSKVGAAYSAHPYSDQNNIKCIKNNLFCWDCISDWQRRNGTCPMCKQQINIERKSIITRSLQDNYTRLMKLKNISGNPTTYIKWFIHTVKLFWTYILSNTGKIIVFIITILTTAILFTLKNIRNLIRMCVGLTITTIIPLIWKLIWRLLFFLPFDEFCRYSEVAKLNILWISIVPYLLFIAEYNFQKFPNYFVVALFAADYWIKLIALYRIRKAGYENYDTFHFNNFLKFIYIFHFVTRAPYGLIKIVNFFTGTDLKYTFY